MPSFLIDEQLPPLLADRLAAIGCPATHLLHIGLLGADDIAVAAEAMRRKAVLITKDEDFVLKSNLGLIECQIVWIRFGNTTNKALWARLEPVWDGIVAALEAGERLIEIA